eukprot:CCRYP_012835-RE/>CCRYP_012835-RE protein AED:0.06 eAED:0.06 QI:569/1/1/1/0.71/0.5/8/453/755
MFKPNENAQKNQMKNPKEGKNEKKQENKKNEKAQQNESKKDKKKSPGKKEQTSKNLFDTKKKKKESVKKDEAKKKKQDDENKQQEDSKKPKKKPDKKEKKQTTNDKKANNKNKLDNRAIRIRERCQTPLNIYRTCYERAVDPSNNLDDDQFQLRNPFSQPFIDHDEWMVADTMHVELTQEAIVMKNGEVQCNDMLAMEELILKYLKDNIGNSDTFSPICAFIGDSAIENELVNDGSGKVMETIALKIDVVFAFKRQFAQEIESSSQQNELRRHLLERNLTGCNRGGYGLCCSSKAFNSRGARGSATCGGGCGSSKCQRKKKKKSWRSLSASNTWPDLYKEAFDQVVSLFTLFKPEETRGILDAKSTEDVAACAVNRYIEDTLEVPSFTCQKYREYQCINNEDLVPDEADLACVSETDKPPANPCSPVSCPGNQSCDPTDGLCKDDEMLMPCIAVIDEDTEDYFDNSADWLDFRATYPDRPFCLLIPFNAQDSSRVGIPPEALSDPKFQVHNVTRDRGIAPADDWFTLCGLDKLGLSNVRFVGLFVDESGSMYKSTVENSYNKFLSDVSASNLKICEVRDGNEDWTTPFMTTLSPNGGTCEEAKPSTSVSTTSSTTTTVATKTTTVTTTKDCNDNNPCTLDLWDPTNQSCIHTIKNCSSYSKYHQCDSKDGRCKPICTDNDLCTTDVWDPQLNSCSNTLVSCPANQSCDPADGQCKSDEMLVPCIAVIDEDDYQNNTADWGWHTARSVEGSKVSGS